MRVITGTARGRKLKEPIGNDIRPTTDQVKESIFNICQFDIEGRKVLDLFGGSGQLGIEAASRGAEVVDIIDAAPTSIKLIKENVTTCGLKCNVIMSDALGYLGRCSKYDLIFLDPPYDSDLCEKALFLIKEFDILTEGGIIVCETRADTTLPVLQLPYFLKKTYKYGKIKLSVFSKE